MKNLNKKAGYIADILSFFFFVVLSTIALMIAINFLISPITTKKVEYKIEEIGKNSEQDQFLISYLRFPAENGNMADLIALSYINDDYAQFEKETSELINSLHENKVEWRAFIDGNEKANQCDNVIGRCSGEQIDYEATLPVFFNKNTLLIKFHLEIFK